VWKHIEMGLANKVHQLEHMHSCVQTISPCPSLRLCTLCVRISQHVPLLPGLPAVPVQSEFADAWHWEINLEILSGFYYKNVWLRRYLLIRQSGPQVIWRVSCFGIPCTVCRLCYGHLFSFGPLTIFRILSLIYWVKSSFCNRPKLATKCTRNLLIQVVTCISSPTTHIM
jgi:hypothetical protein